MISTECSTTCHLRGRVEYFTSSVINNALKLPFHSIYLFFQTLLKVMLDTVFYFTNVERKLFARTLTKISFYLILYENIP